MAIFLLVARYVVVGTLLFAACAKLVSPTVRAGATSQVAELLGPERSVPAAGKVLMATELVAGALAAVPTRLSVLPALAVLALLTAGSGVLVHRGSMTPCACFGERSRPLSVHHVACNAVVTLLAGAALMQASAPTLSDAAVAAGLGAATAFLISRLDDVIEVLRATQSERKAS